MTNKLKLKFFALMLTVLAGASLSSCDDLDFYGDELVGAWGLVESGGQPVYDYQTDYYTFNRDGSGYYSYYDRYGQLWDEPFTWSVRMGSTLYLQYDNPQLGDVTCYYSYEHGYMYFSTDPSFNSYTVYSPTSW